MSTTGFEHGLLLDNIIHQLHPCLILFPTAGDDLVVLELVDDDDHLLGLFVICTVDVIDALFRQSQNSFFGRDLL